MLCCEECPATSVAGHSSQRNILHVQQITFLLLNHRILLISGQIDTVVSQLSRNWLVRFTEILDCLGVFNYKLIPEGKIVNKEMSFDVHRRLSDAVRRKRSEKWITNS